jgi:hypothetical protein
VYYQELNGCLGFDRERVNIYINTITAGSQ